MMSLSAPLPAVEIQIPVVNPGFESPALSDGMSQGNVPGWSALGTPQSLTAWNPLASEFTNGVPQGYNVGDVFLSPANSGFRQELQGALGQLQADTSYTLRVRVGNYTSSSYDGYIIQLAVDGVVIAQDDNSVSPANGAFSLATLTYDYNAALHAGLVGQPLEIRLLTKGLTFGTGGVAFDDVRMSFTASGALARPGFGYRVNAVTPLSLDGSNSIPTDGHTISNYSWDLNNDDTFGDVTGATPAAISYATLKSTWNMVDGDNTIQLRVVDSSGDISTTSTTVTLFKTATYTGPNANRSTERWFVPGNWSTNEVPIGPTDVIIPANITTFGWNSQIPEYTGNLYLNTNSRITFGWTTGIVEVYNMMGTPGQTTMYMGQGSRLGFRMGGNPQVPGIVLNGDAEISMGESTQGGADADFDYPVTGNYRLTVSGNNAGRNFANMNAVNTFGSARAINGVTLLGNLRGSLGLGDISIEGSSILEINAEGAMSESATLTLSTTSSKKIQMDADNTISALIVSGIQMPAGSYGSSASTATNKVEWMAGTGVLTVTESPSSYWDTNGTTAGSGGTAPSGTWGGGAQWNANAAGTGIPNTWISGGTAAFSAGTDATGNYSVSVGQPSGISITNQSGGNEVFQNVNSSPTGLVNQTIASWDLAGGNAVVLLISAINAENVTATFGGQAMTVVDALSVTQNGYSAIAYIIDPSSSIGDLVINMPYDNTFPTGTNTGGYGHFGSVYSILSLSGVASAGAADIKELSRGDRNGTVMNHTTSSNNGFVVGVGSDTNWRTGTKSVTGNCSNYLFQSSTATPTPGYYNTVQAYGNVPVAATYGDIWYGELVSIVTLPLEAKPVSNPSFSGQQITGLRFEDGNVNLTGLSLEMMATSNLFSASSGATGTIATQLKGIDGAGISKKGAGTVVLGSSLNNFNGPIDILSGTIRSGAHDSIPNACSIRLAGSSSGDSPTLDLAGFNDTVGAIELAGNPYSNGATISTGAGTLTLGGNVLFNALDSPQGATINGNLALGTTRTLLVGDSGSADNDLTISATTSGAGGLTKSGIGTLVLSGNASHAGLTTLSEGLTIFSAADNSGATGGITVGSGAIARFDTPAAINGTTENLTIQSGGVIYFGNSFGAGNIVNVLANRIVGSSTGVVACDNYANTPFNFSADSLNVYLGAIGNVTYSGTITPNAGTYRVGGGPGALILPGANALTGANALSVGGNVILHNSNNLSGATTIEASGRLQIGNGATSGSLSNSLITSNSLLVFNRSDDLDQGTDFLSPIAGTGVVEQAGSGDLLLDEVNNHSGGTNLVAGSLTIGDPDALGFGPLNLYGGTLDVTGAMTLADNDVNIHSSFTYGGTADIDFGFGFASHYGTDTTITINGTGRTLTFGSQMTNTSWQDQILTVNGPGNTLVLAGYEMSEDIDSSGLTITFGGSADIEINGTIEDWSDLLAFDERFGTVIKNGTGKLTYSGFGNNYTGQTIINEGVLDITSGTQESDFIVNNGGTIGFTLDTTITTSGSLTLNQGHKVRITGTPTLTSYVLMTAEDGIFSLTPTLEVDIPGYALSIDGNDLVLGPPLNPDAPLLTDISDDFTGTEAVVNQVITYTLTFDQDMDDTTFDAADFANAGSSGITVGAITETGPTTGIFTVEITPTTAGTLRLQIPTTATLADMDANLLDSDPAINDDNVITVGSFTTWSGGADFETDTNGDGVANGMAWLFGAANININSFGLSPFFDTQTDENYVIFSYRRSAVAEASGAQDVVKFSDTLTSWTDAEAGPNIIIEEYTDFYEPGVDLVEVKISRTLINNNRIFALLNLTE